MKVKVFDFFSGCGGASHGFRDADMDIAFALDCDLDSQRSYETNFPSTHFEPRDIEEVPIGRVRSLVLRKKPNPVLFSGCAPCQPYTRQNTKRPRRSDDDRVPLLSRFGRFVAACKPDILFVENVPGLQKLSRRNQPFGGFLQILRKANYYFDYRAVRMMSYGIPQSRRRLILVGSRHGPIDLPQETHGPGTTNPYETVRDWIGSLPPIAAGEEHETILDHRAARLSGRNLERIRATPPGGGHKDWPRRLRLNCHERIGGYSDVYGRMLWDRPATGLTTRCISYSNGRFGHPEQDRAISIREAACLQTFPLDFQFRGSMSSIARQIGNAVPAKLTASFGEHFKKHLKDVGVLS